MPSTTRCGGVLTTSFRQRSACVREPSSWKPMRSASEQDRSWKIRMLFMVVDLPKNIQSSERYAREIEDSMSNSLRMLSNLPASRPRSELQR